MENVESEESRIESQKMTLNFSHFQKSRRCERFVGEKNCRTRPDRVLPRGELVFI